MAQVQYIKDLYENEEKSLREISRITGHSFETVQKYAQKENWNEDNLPDTEPTSYPVLGEFIPIVDGWLEADRKVPRKQRHTAWRLFCRLRDEYGFRGSYANHVFGRREDGTPFMKCCNHFIDIMGAVFTCIGLKSKRAKPSSAWLSYELLFH